MPSAPPNLDDPTPSLRARIPGDQLNGPTIVTIEQADGTLVRMKYVHRERSWRSMLLYVSDGAVEASPLPPICAVCPAAQA